MDPINKKKIIQKEKLKLSIYLQFILNSKIKDFEDEYEVKDFFIHSLYSIHSFI